MKRFTLFKHSMLALATLSLFLGLWTMNSINLKENDFVNQLLLSSFSLSSAFLLYTYRISLIGLTRIQWIPFVLTIIIMSLLGTMNYATLKIPNIWDFTIVLFLLLVCYTIIQRISHKNTFSYFVKGLIYVTLLLIAIAVALKIGSQSYYDALNLVIIIASTATVVHFFLPKKITQ